MNSSEDDLWNEFAAETEEHLDAIERLLSDQRTAERTREEIGELFRCFHSLKGTFLAMGFSNVEALAHRCEDILSVVRDGRSALDADLSQVLLRAGDHLKGMREEVISTRRDAKPASDVLRELDRHCEPQRPVEIEPALTVSADAPLADDPEMLAIYSELLEQRLPIVASALSPISADRAAASETAGELAHGAEMMGFGSLSEQLRAIVELAKVAGEAGQRDAVIFHFSELREQARIIEEVTGVPSGGASLAASLTEPLFPDYAIRLSGLAAAVERFDHDVTQSAGVAIAAGALRVVVVCLGLERSSRLLVLIEERFSNGNFQDASRLPAIREAARISIEALRAYAETAADINAENAGALGSQWAATFRAPSAASEAAAESRLRPEVLATLSEEQRLRLQQALKEGLHAYELLLDLETNSDIAGDIIAWLTSAVETITSRTVYHDGASYFEFLIFSEHTSDWLHSQLTAIDPEQACLRGIGDLGRASDRRDTRTIAEASASPIRAPLVRVQSETIDHLMAEVGEMRTALANLANVLQRGRIATALHDARYPGQSGERQDPELDLHIEAMEGDLNDLKTLEHALEGAHRRIWAAGLQLRVVPVDGLLGRLSRAARDLAQKLGKDVDVVIEGREVRIDKSMVDLLIDPLMHMVRNAIDHGVEPPNQRQGLGKPARAKLVVSASERGNSVDIVIEDDGQGMDKSRILATATRLGLVAPHQTEQMTDQQITALIFRPGFSTADAITEISGRGVGLDVVAEAVQRLGGMIDLVTSLGVGTKFILKLPVSAALLRTLLVEVGTQIFALPDRQIVAVLEVPADELKETAGRLSVNYRGAAVPVQRLAAVLGFETTQAMPEFAHMVIVSGGGRTFALHVDRILRFQDLFLKELHPMLAAVPAIAGASVLVDGWPVLVLDTAGLVGPADGLHTLEATT